jgi:hypothetical protein
MRRTTNPIVLAGTALLVVLAIGIVAVQKHVGKLHNDEIAPAPPQAQLNSPSTPAEPESANQNTIALDSQDQAARPPRNTQSRKLPSAEPRRTASRARQPALVELQTDDRPIARQALSFVGADPDAENVWVQAINDPGTSAHDRQDLIEDLNEDGFPDPQHVTSDDLPLIESRIALIEQLAPDSLDDVNAAAFAEAYKDLINMHAQAMGQ